MWRRPSAPAGNSPPAHRDGPQPGSRPSVTVARSPSPTLRPRVRNRAHGKTPYDDERRKIVAAYRPTRQIRVLSWSPWTSARGSRPRVVGRGGQPPATGEARRLGEEPKVKPARAGRAARRKPALAPWPRRSRRGVAARPINVPVLGITSPRRHQHPRPLSRRRVRHQPPRVG